MKKSSTKIQISDKFQWPKFKTVRFVVAYQYADRNISEIGFSDLDIIWNLGIGI